MSPGEVGIAPAPPWILVWRNCLARSGTNAPLKSNAREGVSEKHVSRDTFKIIQSNNSRNIYPFAIHLLKINTLCNSPNINDILYILSMFCLKFNKLETFCFVSLRFVCS